tara:strand:- start:25 stop:210 length:186 start_codon:yes stop_codon:yes gene_type:complete
MIFVIMSKVLVGIIGGFLVGGVIKKCVDEYSEKQEHHQVVNKYGKFVRAKSKSKKSYGTIL